MKNIALLLMGGIGNRFKSKKPKQFYSFYQTPLFVYTLINFCKVDNLSAIVIVLDFKYLSYVKKWIRKMHLRHNFYFAHNGSTRYESLLNGITYINKKFCGVIKVISHDMVRPFIPSIIIKKHVNTNLKTNEMINTIIPLADSIIKYKNNSYNLLKRDDLYLIQTPQTFISSTLSNLIYKHFNEYKQYTDICSFGIKYHLKIKNVVGDATNFKVTKLDDLSTYQNIKKQIKAIKRKKLI